MIKGNVFRLTLTAGYQKKINVKSAIADFNWKEINALLKKLKIQIQIVINFKGKNVWSVHLGTISMETKNVQKSRINAKISMKKNKSVHHATVAMNLTNIINV